MGPAAKLDRLSLGWPMEAFHIYNLGIGLLVGGGTMEVAEFEEMISRAMGETRGWLPGAKPARLSGCNFTIPNKRELCA